MPLKILRMYSPYGYSYEKCENAQFVLGGAD